MLQGLFKLRGSVNRLTTGSRVKKLLRGVAAAMVAVTVVSHAHADSFSDLLPDVLENHDRVKAAISDLNSAREGVDLAIGDYLPTFTLNVEGGHERRDKVFGSADTSTGFYQTTLRANQLIWDMGSTLENIDRSRLSAELADVRLRNTKQALIREALDAYLNLFQAYNTYNFAIQSEDNIKRQTGLEEALVERNSGLASDLLQSKSALAGAEAGRIQAEGALINAKNRYQNVFKHDPGNLEELMPPRLPVELVPETLDDAMVQARDNNLNLIIASMEVAIAESQRRTDDINLTGASINLVGEAINKNNVGGTLGFQDEKLIKVEADIPLYNAGKDQARYRQSLSNESSARSRLLEQQHGVDEAVRNAWQALQTNRDTARLLETQANLASEFLEIAKEERRLGNRSLIDILNQETQFVNSLSAAEAAKTSVALAVYDLLLAVGQLDENLFADG